LSDATGTTRPTAASRPEAGGEPEPRVPFPSGRGYRVTGRPERITPALAAELRRVLERFAREAGFDAAGPVEVEFRPGVLGHHRVGRAADIYGVAGLGLDAWKRRWDAARREAAGLPPVLAARRMELERGRNLGWRLYKTLQRHGRWSQPYGYPIQLFGPWTRSEGPWRPISERLLRAHRDHIHVAK
jgi:hypothetical protein